jgi:hypothetical protein
VAGQTSAAVLRLTIVIAVGWVIAFWPARLARPEHGVLWMSIAALCCLVPGWIVVLLEKLTIFRSDLNLILGQMAVRFMAVMVACVAVKWRQPQFGFVDFYGWLIGFYLLAMIVEVVLLREKFEVLSKSRDTEESLPAK